MIKETTRWAMILLISFILMVSDNYAEVTYMELVAFIAIILIFTIPGIEK